MNIEKIGKYIATLRKKQKLTQKELAEKLNVTDKAVSKWENGRCMPDVSLFEPLCAILNITVSDLLNGEKIKNDNSIDVTDKLLIRTIDYSNKKVSKIKKKYLIITILIFISMCVVMFISDYNNVLRGEKTDYMLKIYGSNSKDIYIGFGYKMIRYKNSNDSFEDNIKFGFYIFSWNVSPPIITPPSLSVINKRNRILTQIGSYCIKTVNNGLEVNTCSDAIPLTKIKYSQYLDASFNDIISINNDTIKIHDVTLYSTENNKPIDIEIDSDEYSFVVPNIKGTFYVKLDTLSEIGTCWYSFKLDIK